MCINVNWVKLILKILNKELIKKSEYLKASTLNDLNLFILTNKKTELSVTNKKKIANSKKMANSKKTCKTKGCSGQGNSRTGSQQKYMRKVGV